MANLGFGFNDILESLRGPQISTSGSPPLNPNVPDPRPKMGGLDELMMRPGNRFLFNLLAQSGYSTVPQSPLGAVGRAALLTQQQNRESQMGDLRAQLFRSQIGLNQAKAEAEGVGGGKPLTDLAKLRADYDAGRITEEAFNARRSGILRENIDNQFDQTQALRAEFRKDTDGLRQSQSDLAKAKALLISDPNPIGATAAFTAFIRSIDNSVVRPAEQAAYSSAGGLARRIEDELNKLSGEGPLGPQTRRDLLKSIETLEEQLDGMMMRTVDFYNDEAGNFQLTPASITGIPSMESPVGVIPDQEEIPPPTNAEQAQLQSEIDALEAEIAELERQQNVR